jgi:2'-5' RNA ligase
MAMPLAVTLRLDDAAAGPIAAMWRALAEAGVDDGCLRLGYPPHVTMAIWPDEAPVESLAAAAERFGAEWDALPLALAGFGVFSGRPRRALGGPGGDRNVAARQAALVAAVGESHCHEHYRPGRWVPHVTLGHTHAPGRALEVLAPLWRAALPGRLHKLDAVRFRPVAVLRSLQLRKAGTR